MRLFVLLAASLLAALPATAEAASRGGGIGTQHPFGLGAVIGAPTGITGKLYFKSGGALEASIATWLSPYGWYDGYYAHLEYLWHPAVLARSSGFTMPFHVGVGGFITDGDSRWAWYDRSYRYGWAEGGPRGVIGLDFDLTKIPLQFFVDAGVNVTVLPGFWPGATLGTGARYYF